MNILALADRPPGISIPTTIQQHNIDLVITLGDLDFHDIRDLSRVTVPKIGVYGNHDSGTYMPELGIWDMHGSTWDFGGFRFGGFQGCVRYKDNPQAIMFTQAEANRLMQGFPPVDIFISHCPPRGINDEAEITHQGFDSLRQYLEINQPKLWLHGHTYPTADNITTQFGPTRVQYVFEHKIISI